MNEKVTVETVCSKWGKCHKHLMVLDKDLAGDWQYTQVMNDVCRKCKERGEDK